MIATTKDTYVQEVYRVVDQMDAGKLCELLDENCVFRFANMPAVEGKGNIRVFLENFYKSIKDIRHDQLEDWQVDGVRFAIGRVNYTRHDDSVLSVPFSVVLKMNGELIKDYLIYVDASQLYT